VVGSDRYVPEPWSSRPIHGTRVTALHLDIALDRSDAFPWATDVESLEEAISTVLEAPEPPGAEAARVALGSNPDALASVLDLVSEAARG